MSDQPVPRGVSAREFFDALHGRVTMTDAHVGTRVSYSTIHRASKGADISAKSARSLEVWSRGLGHEVFISAALTLGLHADAQVVDDGEDPHAVEGAA